jgi:hypothetical protein
MGAFWEKRQRKTLVNVRLQDLQAQFPQVDIRCAHQRWPRLPRT